MLEQHIAHVLHRWRRQDLAGGQKMGDLAEDPGIALGGTADHQAVGARGAQHLRGLIRAGDVAVGDDRDAHRRLDGGDGFVFGFALVLIGARAAVHGQQLHAAVLGEAGDGDAVAVLPIPAGANLEGDRHVDGPYHRLQNIGHQRLVTQQRRTGGDIADFLGRTTHINVDDLRALVDVDAGRLGHHGWIGAEDLYRARFVFAAMIGAPTGLLAAPEQRIAGHHFGHGHARAEPAAQGAKRPISDTGHRREKQIVL